MSDQFNARFATSYVTGAHNVKTGFTILRGNVTGNTINRADDVGGLPISYTFNNGAPTSMTLFAEPQQRRTPRTTTWRFSRRTSGRCAA